MSLPRIAVDAMGGDEGVRVMVEGAALARRRHDRFKFLLVGDETRIKAALEDHPNMRGASEILHAPEVVSGEEKPTQALRRARINPHGQQNPWPARAEHQPPPTVRAPLRASAPRPTCLPPSPRSAPESSGLAVQPAAPDPAQPAHGR